MSVNEKMTALADEIRELSGTTSKKGIDAMISDVDAASTEISEQTDLLAQILAKVNRLPEAGGGSGSGGGSGEDLGRYIEGSLSILYNEHATSVIDRAFYGSIFLEEVTLPNVTYLGAEAFQNCAYLRKVDFSNLETIMDYVFYQCEILEALIIRNTELVVNLGSYNALSGTRISDGNGYIYVPRDLVDSYKSETNWADYADQIVALEDNTIDGTITGEIVLPEFEELFEAPVMLYPDGDLWLGVIQVPSYEMTWGEFIFQEDPMFNSEKFTIEVTEDSNIRFVPIVEGYDSAYYAVRFNEDMEHTLAKVWDPIVDEMSPTGSICVMSASELGLE